MRYSNWGDWVRVCLAGLVLAAGLPARGADDTPAAKQAVPAKASPPAATAAETAGLPPGEVTLGMEFGDQQAQSYGDAIVPLFLFDSGLLFLNPRASYTDDHAQEFNLGAGCRYLVPNKNMIAGGNVFFDYRDTALDNQFSQAGFGLEFLSRWVDARWNYYLPDNDVETYDTFTTSTHTEKHSSWNPQAPYAAGNAIYQEIKTVERQVDVTTLQHWRMQEEAMEGYDAEIGALLPIPVLRDFADVKAFVGCYDFNGTLADDVRGVKARLEVRPMPSVYLDAQYFEDEDLYGSTYSVGARVRLPFDVGNLVRGRNPFAGTLAGFKPARARAPVSARLTDMVMRDLHIRTDVSDPEEVVQDRRVIKEQTISRRSHSKTETLMSDVIFVDEDNESGVEDGSWEHPFDKIQEGVDNPRGLKTVYVLDAYEQYLENVRLLSETTLLGNGAPIMGAGGRPFGNGVFPVVNGQGMGPAITLADHTAVAGFEIAQPQEFGIAGQSVAKVEDGIDSSHVGVYGLNVDDVTVRNNYIHGSGSTDFGVLLESFDADSLTAWINDNRIEDIQGPGIHVLAGGVGDVDLTLANNTVVGSYGPGVDIRAEGGDTFIARVSGDYSGNEWHGVCIDASDFDAAGVLFVDTRANGNGGDGINVSLSADFMAGALFASSVDLGRAGQLVDGVAGMLSGAFPFMASDDPNNSPSRMIDEMLGLSQLTADGIMEANDNGGNGVKAEIRDASFNVAVMMGAEASRNGTGYGETDFSGLLKRGGGRGVDIEMGSDDNVSVAALMRCRANGNYSDGIRTSINEEDAAVAVFADVQANDNGGNGIRGEVNAWGEDGVAVAAVLSTDPLVNLLDRVGGWVADEIGGSPLDLGFIPPFGMVQASGNSRNGIDLDVNGGDFALAGVLDAMANGNDNKGVKLDVMSKGGDAVGLVGSTRGLMDLALGALAQSDVDMPFDLASVGVLGPLQANGNGDSGIRMDVTAYGTALAGVAGVEANNNGGIDPSAPVTLVDYDRLNPGIKVTASSVNDDALAGFAGVTASGNGGAGIKVKLASGEETYTGAAAGIASAPSAGDVTVVFMDVTANDNGRDGITARLDAGMDGEAYAIASGVTANDNARNGLYLDVYADDDLGIAVTDSSGRGNGDAGPLSAGTPAGWRADGYDLVIAAENDYGVNGVWVNETAVDDLIAEFGLDSDIPEELVDSVPQGPNDFSSCEISQWTMSGENKGDY